MSRRLRRRAAQLGRDAEVLDATADQLPFPDASFDTAVVTFTLCSVPDEQAALSEITRVLVPGGRLLFFEHVRSADPRIAARRDKIPFPCPLIGCHPNGTRCGKSRRRRWTRSRSAWRAAEGAQDRKVHDRGHCPQASYRLTARGTDENGPLSQSYVCGRCRSMTSE